MTVPATQTLRPLLEARSLVKRFGEVTALGGVSMDLRSGEVHALCGENGAGKSTLIKVLSGIHPAGTYEGEILLDGKKVRFASPGEATASGIAVIYQELALVPEMTVAENIFLGTEPTRFGGLAVDFEKMEARAQEMLDQFGLGIKARTRIGGLGIGQRQLVEIVKALSKKSRILILDEPTAALTEREVNVLLGILRLLRERGLGLVYISHKLDEVLAIADRITVLRDGKSVGTVVAGEVSRGDVIHGMVGREIADLFPRRAAKTGKVALKVSGLTVEADGWPGQALSDISFEVAEGEVLGIGGLMGAGRTELLMHIFGAFGRRVAGQVQLKGRTLPTGQTPESNVREGMALVSEDRKRYGLVLERDLSFNFSLSSLEQVTHGGFIDEQKEAVRNGTQMKQLAVRASGLTSMAGRLSGGNQQKVVIGKALLASPSVVFLDEPTRGIDVGAKVDVYQLINQFTEAGKAVVLVSSELPELMGMSDRIIMLAAGRVQGEFTKQQATQEALMTAAMGGAKAGTMGRGTAARPTALRDHPEGVQ